MCVYFLTQKDALDPAVKSAVIGVGQRYRLQLKSLAIHSCNNFSFFLYFVFFQTRFLTVLSCVLYFSGAAQTQPYWSDSAGQGKHLFYVLFF